MSEETSTKIEDEAQTIKKTDSSKKSIVNVLTVSLIFVLGLGVIFFLITSIRFFWFRPVIVDGKSMMPTIEPDTLKYVNTTAKPDIGDIAVFYYVPSGDADPSYDYYGANAYFRSMPIFGKYIKENYSGGYEMMIKRVVAKGGDVVELRAETVNDVNFIFLYVNGEKFKDDVVMLDRDNVNDATYNYAFELTQKYGPEATHGVSAMAPKTVEEDCYYVLGDNRDGSRDSRTFGAINQIYFVGTIRR